jgi:hypothetical protein
VEILGNLLDVWRDLTEAYHGKASHGYEAEIYAYKFIGHFPSAEHCGHQKAWIDGFAGEEPLGKEAARSAHEVFSMYERRYDCKILISGQKGWISIEVLKEALFDHRIHVKVVSNKNQKHIEDAISQAKERLRVFEEKYHLCTMEFISRYENDEYKETLDFDEWIGEYRMLQRLLERKEREILPP